MVQGGPLPDRSGVVTPKGRFITSVTHFIRPFIRVTDLVGAHLVVSNIFSFVLRGSLFTLIFSRGSLLITRF